MGAISRYILRQLLATVVGVTVILTAAVWLSQSLRMISMIVNDGLSIGAFLYFTSLLLPTFFAMALPVGAGIAVMMIYSRLITDSELTIMRAVGRGPWQLAAPAFVASALVVTMGYVMSMWVLPASLREFRSLQRSMSRDAAILLVQEGTFNHVAPGVTVYIRAREPNGEMRGVFVHDARDADAPITILADRGLIGATDAGPRIVLINGTRQQISRDRTRLEVLQFERNTMDIPRNQNAGGEAYLSAPERYMSELLWPGDNERDRRNANAFFAEINSRISGPLVSLAFMLVALSALLSGEFNRRGRMGRLAVAGVVTVIGQIAYMGALNLALRFVELVPLQYVVLAVVTIGATWQMGRNSIRRPAGGRGAVAAART
jgi:lipopolysaccharide export system permease protein